MASGQGTLLGSEIDELADRDPREAILRAYETVRLALERGLHEVGVEIDGEGLDALDLIRAAESRGVTPPEVTDAIVGLNVLRNLAAHAPSHDASPARAREFIVMSDAALFALARALREHLANAPAKAA